MRRSHSMRVPLAALALLAACQDGTITAPPSSGPGGVPSPAVAAINDAPVNYFAPRTIGREGSGVQTVQFPLNDRDHSQFMEPFVLRVRADGDQRIVGIVRVDGVPVLERRDLVALGKSAEPISLEVSVGPSSVVTVELQGPSGGTLTFWIDALLQPPPVITIMTPVRHAAGDGGVDIGHSGAFLQQGTLLPSPVEITGTACHVRFPITELEVAGVSVPVAGTNLCEPFTVTQQSRWGLSIITGTARNARGRVGTVVQSYARSPEYYQSPKDLPGAVSIPGFFTHINQPALDDGDRATVNDIAGFLESRFNGLDFPIPARTLVPCTEVVEVGITGGRMFQSLRVNSIRATRDGLAIDISALGPSIGVLTRVEFNFLDGNCVGGFERAGSISATEIRFTATARPSVSPLGVVDVGLVNLGINVNGLNANLGVGIADKAVELASAAAHGFLRDFVLEFVTPIVGDLLQDALNPMTEWPPLEIPLNSALLRVTGRLATIATGGTAPDGFARFSISGQLEGLTLDPTVRATRGAIRGLCGTVLLACPGGVSPVPPFSATAYDAGLSVHQDMLNSAFWTAWRAGAFNIPDVSALPGVGTLTASSMSSQATLPPVSMASGDELSMFEMAWGDVRVRSTFDPATIGAMAGAPIEVESWVSVVVRGNLAVDGVASRLTLAGVTTDVHVELITSTFGASDDAVRAAIQADVREVITRLSRDAIRILPLDLSVEGLGTIVAADIFRSNSYYLMVGRIE